MEEIMTIGKKAWLLTLLLAALFTLQLYAQFSGGSGTEADPYQVATATDLNNVRNYLSSYFIQTANIDLGVAPWNVGEGWVPIGTGSAFSGNYDGNEHYIYSLFINRPGVAYQGLFSILDNSEVTYLNLENVQIIGGDYTGSLAGIGRNWTSIYNSTITGSVQGDNLTGGFLGQLLMVSGLIDCKFIGTVTGDNSVGGCVGDSYSNDGAWNGIHTSIVQGSISGFDHVGGIIGSMGIRNVINKCVSTADISGNSFVGGLAGSGYHFNVDQCYNIGNVSGNSVIGGVVGGSNGAFSSGIHYSYSYGSVSGISESGGLLGRGGGIGVNYCYWDTQISGIDHSIGGEGRTTDEMTYPYAANTYVGWDFDTIWHSDPAMLNGGYPYLNQDWLAPTANDLDAVLLSGDTTPMVNTATTYSISVKNRGSAAQSEYTVKLFGTGDVELGSVAGTPIAPGETLTYEIDWTPCIAGPATLYGKVILTGDENPYNDQTNQLQVNVLPPYTLYFNDFAASAGSEWSDTTITTAPNGGEKFLGRFGNQAVTLNENDIPAHNKITVEFDLYTITSWDGNGPYGPDYWEYSIDGVSQLLTTFAINTGYGQVQSYPDNYSAEHPARTGAVANDVLGWGTGESGDAVYHITKTIEHTGSSLLLSFAGSNLQGIDDESWGIDNILITYSDQPVPDFSVSEHSGQLPFSVNFTDTSLPGLAPITSWAWDFDSNGTIDSNLQNPNWTYTQPGNYDVTLTVGDGTNTVTKIEEDFIHVENTTLGNGLVRYYPFDGNAVDYSGHGENGYVNGLTITEDRYGFEDDALRVDTDDDYISIPDVSDPEMSISVWYYFERTDGSCNSILANRRNVPGNYNHLFTSPEYNLGEHPNGWNMSSYYLQPNNWYHFVILKSNNQMRLYVNNALVMDVSNSFSNAIAPLNIIGNVVLTGGEAAYGVFDELRIYNRLLNPVEVNRLYTTNTSSNECFARFSATPTSGVRPLQVQFTDESIQGLNPITSWAWDLNGDGEIESTQQHPSYVYPRPGTYTVTLTVSDGTYSDTLTKTDLINVSLPGSTYSIIAPALNDRWLVGSYQNIEWVIPDTYTNITLDYSPDNSDTWTEIVRSVPANQYSYNWMVPDTPSDSCKIRIKDRATPIVLYESELFEICRPSGFEGMVAHFPLDANTNDSSGNANHGTNNGAVPTEDRFGSPNSAYSFDGNSYIHLNLQNGNMLDTSNTGAKTTVAFWMKWDGTDNMIVYGWYDFALWFYNGYFGFNSSNSDIYSIPSASFINNWVHVVAEFTNNSPYENELYINGVLQNLAMQNSYPLNVTIRNQARISGWLQNESYKFRGIVDDMYIFNRALNVDEVSDLYLGNLSILLAFIEPEATTSLITNSVQDIFWYADNAISTVDIEFSGDNGITWQMLADDLPAQQYHYNWTVPDTVAAICKLRVTANTGETVVRAFSIVNNSLDAGLVAYYPLDGNAEDASGNGRHGTYQNVVPTSDRYGVLTKAMSFPERNGWIDIPDVTGNVLSASLWYQFQTDSANSNHILNPLGGNRHHIIIDPQGYIGFYNWGFLQSNYRLETGKWYHLALTVENSNYTLYVNGSLIYQSNGMYLNSDYPLAIIGHYETSGSYGGSKGVYDELRLYNRKLSSGEILSLYNQAEQISLTGHITGSNAPDTGLGGVQVTLGESLMSTDTDGNGNFSFTGVSANSQYRLRLQKEGYATQDLYISVPNYNYDLGTFTLYESANVPESVVATQVPAASTTEINWSGAARSVLFSEAAEQGRAFLNYSLYRLLAGEEQNPATWTLVSTLSELVYSDPAWYAVPFGVYKYAVANNYSNGYQGVPVFSNELQRRNYTYSENFDHGGATAPGWTVTHSGTTTHPWMPVLDSGSDYSYKVMNTNLSTANETLLSPSYNCSRYEKVSVSFWHNYVPNVNSQARFQYSINGVTWTTLFTYTSTANSGIKTYDISGNAHNQAAVRFRWLYTATSYNTNSWTIDDFSVYGYTSIPVYLSNPYPSVNRKVNRRTVELGISYIDDDMVNASSLYYRIDANGNGEYDTEEDWIPISGYTNAPQIDVRVQAQYLVDGDNLRYEFKGADLAGATVKYSGSSHTLGIADDYSVDIDTVLPSMVSGFTIDSASFHSVTMSWLPVIEEHFAAYEIYYDTHRGVGLSSNKWSIPQDAALANINTTSTTINALNSGVNYWFRIRAIDQHGNLSELSELLLYVSADLPPVISSPLPSGQPIPAWSNSRTVTIGCSFADYYGIDPASVQYRFDRNGNGVYDTGETWQGLPARTGLAAALKAQTAAVQKQKNPGQMDEDELELYMRNRNLLQVSVPVTFETDGPELRFEFKASDLHGIGPVYTGFYEQAGIDDDWFVRIDTQNPADISSIYIGVVNPNSIEVAWSRSSDQYFMTYEVYYATHPDVTIEDQIWDWTDDPVLAYTGGDIVVSNVIGLIDNTMYYFRVRAVDEAGNASPLSNEVNAFYGTASPPALPQNLIIQKIGDDVILSWDPVTEDTNGNPITVTGYNIYASDLPDVVPDIGYLIDASSTTSYNHIGIVPFVDKIFYIVTAVVEEEVRHFDKPNDQRLRTKK